MAWTGLTLTVEGRNALNQAQLSGKIQFKSIVVGDGAAPVNFRTLKNLVHQLYEITDIKVDVTEDGCTITADFPAVNYDYYFREIGIIVTTDEGEKLYVYDNCGEDAQYMVNSTGVETTKKRIRLALAISDVAEITVSAAEILYVAYDDYENTVKNLKQDLQEESSRAQAAEEANKNNLTSHVDDKINPHKVTKAQVGLGNVDNTADINKPISTAQQNALDSAYQQATEYTDQKIADLIGGAPETLDTLKEVADAIQANKEVSTALDAAIGKKADKTALDTHTADSTIHITSAERTNWNDANTKKHTHSNKGVLDKITQALLDSWNAAYSHISDAVKHITAAERTLWNTVSNKVDKVSGKGLSSNDYTTTEKNKLAGIAANANNYAHPTTAGNKHIPSGGSSGQILRWSSDGTAAWGSDNNTTYSTATQSANGLLSAADKKKLDGIATNANNYTHPTTTGNKHIPSGGSSGQILRWSADGTAVWGSDNNTTYSNMTAATASAAGKAGLVPAPAAGKQTSFLRGDGTWQVPTNTTYSTATQSSNGLLSAADKKKLDGIATNANNYAHPTTAGNKHIPSGGSSGQILRWSADGTAVWGSDNNTTYNTATQSTNGLMSAADKKKLDGIAAGANKNSANRRLIKAATTNSVTIKSEYSICSGYGGYFKNDVIKAYTIDSRGIMAEGVLRFSFQSGNPAYYILQFQSTSLGARITGSGNSVTFSVPSNFIFIFLEYTPETTTITIT